MGRLVVVMLCATGLLAGCSGEDPSMYGNDTIHLGLDTFYVHVPYDYSPERLRSDTMTVRGMVDTLVPLYATGDTMWVAGDCGRPLFPVAVIDSVGDPQPLCDCQRVRR